MSDLINGNSLRVNSFKLTEPKEDSCPIPSVCSEIVRRESVADDNENNPVFDNFATVGKEESVKCNDKKVISKHNKSAVSDSSLDVSSDRDPPDESLQDKNSSLVEENKHSNSAHKSRKHRRGNRKAGKHHNRKWKPYSKLTWEERALVDCKISSRAEKARSKSFAAGQPMAPYNTTQFLMDQYTPFRLSEPHQQESNRKGDTSIVSGSQESSTDSDGEEGDEAFMEREFFEVYESYHLEHLQSLNKEELIRGYMELEKKVERLERNLRETLVQTPSEIDSEINVQNDVRSISGDSGIVKDSENDLSDSSKPLQNIS